MLSQNLVQGYVKTWSKYVVQQNWTKFWLKKSVFFSLFCSFFLKILFSLQKEEDFWKTKNRENLDQVLTKKKAIFGPRFDSTTYIYIKQKTKKKEGEKNREKKRGKKRDK